MDNLLKNRSNNKSSCCNQFVNVIIIACFIVFWPILSVLAQPAENNAIITAEQLFTFMGSQTQNNSHQGSNYTINIPSFKAPNDTPGSIPVSERDCYIAGVRFANQNFNYNFICDEQFYQQISQNVESIPEEHQIVAEFFCRQSSCQLNQANNGWDLSWTITKNMFTQLQQMPEFFNYDSNLITPAANPPTTEELAVLDRPDTTLALFIDFKVSTDKPPQTALEDFTAQVANNQDLDRVETIDGYCSYGFKISAITIEPTSSSCQELQGSELGVNYLVATSADTDTDSTVDQIYCTEEQLLMEQKKEIMEPALELLKNYQIEIGYTATVELLNKCKNNTPTSADWTLIANQERAEITECARYNFSPGCGATSRQPIWRTLDALHSRYPDDCTGIRATYIKESQLRTDKYHRTWLSRSGWATPARTEHIRLYEEYKIPYIEYDNAKQQYDRCIAEHTN